MRHGSYRFAWIVAPLRGKHIAPDRHHAALSEVATLIYTALETRVPCIVIGAFGSLWTHQEIDRLTQCANVSKRYHRLCHFGIKIDPATTAPSSSCLVTASVNVVLNGHSCRCPVRPSTSHVMDWTTVGLHRQRNEAMQHISIQILKQIQSQLTIPGLNPVQTSGATMSQLSTPDFNAVPATSIGNLAESSAAALTCVSGVNRSAPCASLAFPTEEKERQKLRAKERKQQGILPQKRFKTIEDHHDDCGTDLSGLGISPELFAEDSPASLAMVLMRHELHSPSRSSLAECLTAAAEHQGAALDLIEICGGEARPTSIALRKGLHGGDNFDLVTGCDLNDAHNQYLVLNYIRQSRLAVILMGPTCSPFGPMANLVKHVRPDAWVRSLRRARPHGKFCGQVALLADDLGLAFLVENPFPSHLWNESEWKQVFARPSTLHLVIHQCAAGQRGPSGLPAKKPTSLISNRPQLLYPCKHFVCPQNHEHEQLEGGKASGCQVWPWKLATAIVDGILNLKRTSAYPSIGIGPGDRTVDPDQYAKCRGCRGHLSKYDARHSRVQGECKWHEETPLIWDCPGCKKDRPEAHDSHTYGPDCKHTIISHRVTRTGRHPRAPAIPARAIPAQEAQAQLPDGSDLLPTRAHEPERHDDDERDPTAASSDQLGQRRGRGPDQGERYRRTFEDAGAGEHTSDWTRYDVTHCLRALRSAHLPTVLKALRKLHLRLWHAGVSNMQSLLRNTGVSQDILDLVPDVIATCRECRAWTSRPRDTVPSLSIAMAFNEIVETDLLFYKEHIVHHFVCRASRWHSAVESPSKLADQLLENISTAWINQYGPMQTLVSDQESGLNTEDAIKKLKRLGVIIKFRGKDQHARYVERRGAILRHTMHVMQSQADREGIKIPFRELLAQAVFCGNSMTHIGGVTPYQAVLGRQPSILPPIVDEPGLDDRRESRIREIAIQSMVSATSAARVGRALKAVTQKEESFQPDDLVELYRTPSSKDVSGWSGPHRVVESRAFDGVVVLRINGQNRPYRIQDVRHALLAIDLAGLVSPEGASLALKVLHAYLAEMPEGRADIFGLIENEQGKMVTTKTTSRFPKVAKAINYIIRSSLQMHDVTAARIGRKVQSLPRVNGPQNNVTINWDMSNPDNLSFHVSESTKVKTNKIFAQQEAHYATMQCIKESLSSGMLFDDLIENQVYTNPHDRDNPNISRSNQDPLSPRSNQRLSTISEETVSDHMSAAAEALYMRCFADAPAQDADCLMELCHAAVNEEEISEILPYDENRDIFFIESHDECSTWPEDLDQIVPSEPEADRLGPYLEVIIESPMSKLFASTDCNDSDLLMKVYLNAEAKKEVISRDTDLLTQEELVTHRGMVNEAIISEFKTWERYKCFEQIDRKKREGNY